VTDAQGGVLPGATVVATHTETGTKYEAVTGGDGRYSILNVRVGGYTLTANMSGFKDQKQDKVQVQLGAEQTADFKLQLATVSETVDVVASTPTIDLARAGTADNISNAVKESLPPAPGVATPPPASPAEPTVIRRKGIPALPSACGARPKPCTALPCCDACPSGTRHRASHATPRGNVARPPHRSGDEPSGRR